MSVTLVWTLVLLAGAVSAETLGSKADIQDFPSIVQVEFHVSSAWVQHCAGAVLTSYHIISTASCFSGPNYTPADRRIRAGSSVSGVNGQVVPVQYATVHPDFGLLERDSDICVARLDHSLLLGDDVKQAYILGEGIELPLGLSVVLAAWGSTAEGNKDANPNLYQLDLAVNDNEWCLLQYLYTETRPIITEKMLCVGRTYLSGRDFDGNDAGAPVFYQDTLIGVLSFGQEDDDRLPLVASHIGAFTGWIIDTASQ